MRQFIKNSCSIILLMFIASSALAQGTKVYQDDDAEFKRAKALYQNDYFNLAYPVFKRIYNSIPNQQSVLATSIYSEAKYYTILCGLHLNDTYTEELAKKFIEEESNAPRVQMMSYQLGEYYYRSQKFDDALACFNKTTIANLSNREIATMKFHQAYAYFAANKFDKAKPLFNSIRQIKTDPNYLDANYYFGFISFSETNYQLAMECFRLVESQQAYEKIVPYYITEILYFSGEKDKAIEYGEKALNAGGQYYELELKHVIGHALFEKKQYARALPYLETYVKQSQKVKREDIYELSYCYYEAKQWQKAIPGFKELGGKEDSLAQNSMYLLADAYLKTNDKPGARSAFLFCSLNSSNAFQKQVSRFSYAKLSFELGYNDIAADDFQRFINDYPQSAYQQEAKELLVNVLANTSNYKDALKLFESLPSQSDNVKKVYPRILYGRAVELVNDQQINEAEQLIDRLMQVPYSSSLMPFANFWKGEIAYRTDRLDDAINYLSTFLKNPQINGEVNLTNAKYTTGYAHLKKEQYRSALGYFEQVVKTVTTSSTAVEQDAYLRSADCYFMDKKYQQALQMYETALAVNLPQADYALYQKAIIAGASNKVNEKINLLQSIEQRFPNSALIPEAALEVANTYLADEKYKDAIPVLNQLLKNKKAESLKPQAYLKLGVAYFNSSDNDNALDNFKKLISGYPNSLESDDAVEYVRNIFVNKQQPGEFVSFMRQNGKVVTYSEEDSLNYASAEIKYNNRDFDNALAGYKNYLSKFPDGRYATEANFLSAEMLNGKKDFSGALPFYTYVAAKAPNKYAEKAVLQAARINYFELKDFTQAEKYFIQLKQIAIQYDNKLEAMRGLLRCQYKLGKWADAQPNALELLQQKSIATDDKMMANMVVAKNYQNNNQLDLAWTNYKAVINLGKSEFAAEALYRLAEILFIQTKYADAEKAAFEVIKKAGSYEIWVTKSYILLGDIYFKQKDYFNAEATFKSVVQNATLAELKEEAQRKLDMVIAEKNKNSKVENGQ